MDSDTLVNDHRDVSRYRWVGICHCEDDADLEGRHRAFDDHKVHREVRGAEHKRADRPPKVIPNRPPYLIRVALQFLKTGTLPWWVRILIHLRFGKFKTPNGVEYNGFKVEFKW